VSRLAAWVRANKAAVALVALVAALAAANLLYTAHAISKSNHAWCGVVTAITSKPVPRPASPAANPSRATSYEWYLRFVRLGHDLGC
jgi:hypothetical protein